MPYIDLRLGGIPLRDMDGKTHSILGEGPDGCIVDQSRKGNQIIQRCWYPAGYLVLSHFDVVGSSVREARGDQIIHFDGLVDQ